MNALVLLAVACMFVPLSSSREHYHSPDPAWYFFTYHLK
jgi:hypothetical protein